VGEESREALYFLVPLLVDTDASGKNNKNKNKRKENPKS